jgi:hypothetical protein
MSDELTDFDGLTRDEVARQLHHPPTYEPLRARDWADGAGEPRYLHAKLDGWRVRAVVDGDDLLGTYTRTQDYTARLEAGRWPWWDALLQLPPLTAVELELWAPGVPATSVPTLIKAGDQRLRATAFAVPFAAGLDIRDATLQVARMRCRNYGLEFAEYWELMGPSAAPGASASPTRAWLLEELRKLNAEVDHDQNLYRPALEGFVLKRRNYVGWWKYKPELTVDCVVTGLVPGNGKFSGVVGALKVSLHDGTPALDSLYEVAEVSGMDDAERRRMGDWDLGRVCEVEFQCVGSRGRLQHPRFLRWREDKPPEECTAAQLEALKGVLNKSTWKGSEPC